jgi:hypothetical protein
MALQFAINILTSFVLVVADCAMLPRLFAVFPKQTTSRTRRMAVIAFPIAMKFARFAVGLLFTIDYWKTTSASTNPTTGNFNSNLAPVASPSSIAIWALALADNM